LSIYLDHFILSFIRIHSTACQHENVHAFQRDVGIVPLQLCIDCPQTAEARSQIALVDAVEPIKIKYKIASLLFFNYLSKEMKYNSFEEC
jgi:hypothetical protein